ncbi:hypothetical protein, partial [Psychrobacter sp. GW64-MNA-CIBAN-0177]|uniref:hypothetical protein n=1 Tax=Psychrobacter sp. GW64-MNA-CIBAN-0177 TaxID=3140449 RepID=UPI0033330770
HFLSQLSFDDVKPIAFTAESLFRPPLSGDEGIRLLVYLCSLFLSHLSGDEGRDGRWKGFLV